MANEKTFTQKMIDNLQYEREVLIAEYLLRRIDSREFINQLAKIDNKLRSYQKHNDDE